MNKGTPQFCEVPFFHLFGEKLLAMFKLKQIHDISMDSYGGLQFFHRFIEKTDFEKTVRQELGDRPAQAKYSYKDVITTFTAMCLAGGSYTEDINILRSKRSSLAGSSYCPSDTFTIVTKQLMDWDHMELKKTEKGTETEFFLNQPVHRLSHDSLKRYFGVKGYKTLDHDLPKI